MLILDPKEGVRFGNCRELDDFYREIGCDCIDIARRCIGGKTFDIFVDDEGLLKDDAGERISAFMEEGDGTFAPQLVGTLVFASHDEAGNTVDLTLDETMLIASRVRRVAIENRDTGEKFANYCIMLDPVKRMTEADFAAWLGGEKT